MNKRLFLLSLLIIFPSYLLANPKDPNTDLCGKNWFGELDFRISVLGYTLCCDRGGQTCGFDETYHKGTNVFSKHIKLDLFEEDIPQNPKEVANREVGIEGLDSKIMVHECADHKTWLRIVRGKEGFLRVFQFTRNATLRFDNHGDRQTKDVSLQEITRTFCKLNPFAVSPSAQIVDSVSSTSSSQNRTKMPRTQTIVTQTNPEDSTIPPTNTLANPTTPSITPKSWEVFNTVFYPLAVPDYLSTLRHFRTADKQQELKINFSSNDKSGFLQKLQKQFPQDSSRIIYCSNNHILFEVKQEVYQAFILSPDAIAVLAQPGNFPPPTTEQLCKFNAMLAW